MKISFVETALPEREFFRTELAAHELYFCDNLEEVPVHAEVLSIFIDSKVGPQFLNQHPALRLIATRSTTYDHIHLEACSRLGIAVRGVESYGDHTVTEHTFALILTLTRAMRAAMASNTGGAFSYESLRSTELNGKTFGVVGAGRIGLQTLRLAKAFGMETIACDVQADPVIAAQIGFQYVTFDELLQRSHVISLNVPLTAETFHLFDRATFAKCRRGVFLINTARGPAHRHRSFERGARRRHRRWSGPRRAGRRAGHAPEGVAYYPRPNH